MAKKEKNKTANLDTDTLKMIVREVISVFINNERVFAELKNPENLVLINETNMKVLTINTILAIEVEDALCVFYLENNQKFEFTNHLVNIETQLPEWFFRINKNTIVNAHKPADLCLKTRTIKVSGHPKIYTCSRDRLRQFRQYIKQNAYFIHRKT
jgi:DNA-binding LytR/AlgR family response regulator